jgi:hypothetical protein
MPLVGMGPSRFLRDQRLSLSHDSRPTTHWSKSTLRLYCSCTTLLFPFLFSIPRKNVSDSAYLRRCCTPARLRLGPRVLCWLPAARLPSRFVRAPSVFACTENSSSWFLGDAEHLFWGTRMSSEVWISKVGWLSPPNFCRPVVVQHLVRAGWFRFLQYSL